MTFKTKLLLASVGAAAILAPQSALAQYYYAQPYGQQALYPYVVVQPPGVPANQAYPYVIQRPPSYAPPRGVRRSNAEAGAHVSPRREFHRTVGKNDPALIEELRRRTGKTIHKTVIVREKPVVVERKRYVDDPPIVVKRHKVVDVEATEPAAKKAAKKSGGDADARHPRVIRAEAEVTILGPDRMSIRLFRKGGLDANAKAGAD